LCLAIRYRRIQISESAAENRIMSAATVVETGIEPGASTQMLGETSAVQMTSEANMPASYGLLNSGGQPYGGQPFGGQPFGGQPYGSLRSGQPALRSGQPAPYVLPPQIMPNPLMFSTPGFVEPQMKASMYPVGQQMNYPMGGVTPGQFAYPMGGVTPGQFANPTPQGAQVAGSEGNNDPLVLSQIASASPNSMETTEFFGEKVEEE